MTSRTQRPGRAGRPDASVLACRRAAAECLSDLSTGSLVLVACSGGADSLALAAAAVHAGSRAGMRVGAVTVDHGLQAGSAERAADVARWLSASGLDPVEVVRVEVGPGHGPEDAARRARYAALESVAERLGADLVLLAHTMDDQAETVLLRLARGSGTRSLAGISPDSGLFRRPFLGLRRNTARAAAAAVDATIWEDPHNRDRSFLRPRVRHDVLPILQDALGPGVVPALARTASLARADAQALEEWAAQAYQEASVDGFVTGRTVPDSDVPDSDVPDSDVPDSDVPGFEVLDVEVLAALPQAVRTRVLRRAALAAGAPAGALTYGHVEAVADLVTSWHGQGPAALPGGVWARRDCGRLLLGPGLRASDHEETGER